MSIAANLGIHFLEVKQVKVGIKIKKNVSASEPQGKALKFGDGSLKY
jgi:hypothetical protein